MIERFQRFMEPSMKNNLKLNEILHTSRNIETLREIGGHWKIKNNKLAFSNIDQCFRNTRNGRIFINQPRKPGMCLQNWHMHPVMVGWWPSPEDLKNSKKRIPTLLVTRYGVWVYSKGHNYVGNELTKSIIDCEIKKLEKLIKPIEYVKENAAFVLNKIQNASTQLLEYAHILMVFFPIPSMHRYNNNKSLENVIIQHLREYI